jgi:metal-responsive CopG/Arc/MetJ family transcriptional regulator
METIQIVIDTPLLKAADRAAKKAKVNRSELVREALRTHLKRMHTLEMEEKERRAYDAKPDSLEDWTAWEREAAWPHE